jgi:hypothetical protein
MTIVLVPLLLGTTYAALQGKLLALPTDPAKRPNKVALVQRWQRFTAK